MTPLDALIRREIVQDGPMNVARYMELCLLHPEHGYYVTRDPLGTAGDFTTAPEISQMFGEMIGVWVAAAWDAMGRPEFNLVELGPGRGTLMADALRVLRGAGAGPEVWFVEASPRLREEQARRVPEANWATSLDQVPEGPAVFVANEFFDALPVRQYLCAADGWRERVVGLEEDRLIWGLAPPGPNARCDTPGEWREIPTNAYDLVADLAFRLKTDTGAALIVDYGYTAEDRPGGPTLQAVRGHEFADPLEAPGEADLTWLINFDNFGTIFSGDGCEMCLTGQGPFLAELGIGHRAEALAKARPDQSNEVADALERLTAPDQMGTLFKVLGVVSPGLSLPPGFGLTT